MSRTYPDREPAGLTTVAVIGDCDLRSRAIASSMPCARSSGRMSARSG
jgi:hypothetical protein